jgi:hypothetical protein
MTIIKTDKPLKERPKYDFYPTPHGLVRAALNLIHPWGIGKVILDPGAGKGNWGIVLREFTDEARLIGVDLDFEEKPVEYDEWYFDDFMNIPLWYVDTVIGNPPYNQAEMFVRKGLEMLKPDGYQIFLLRLAFLASQKRGKGLWKEYPPLKVWTCSRRPSFIPGDRGTGDTDFAIFLWKKGHKGTFEGDWLEWEYDDE